MPYGLGIDLGTSCTVAAISRTHAADAGVEIVPLGTTVPAVSSVLHLGEDGSLLVGAAAEHLALTEPDRVFRGFVRRVGEESPLDGWLQPEALTAWLVRWVIDVVAAREGARPDRIALTHPPGWSLRERQLVQDALLEFGIDDVVFVSAPMAAATGWTPAEALELAETVAVHDLGGMVDATVLARTGTDDFVQLGMPRTLDHAGGAAFDEIVFAHVLDLLGDRVAAADLDDPAVLEGMARLLEDCVVARKELSESAAVAVPVTLPGLDTSVELTRSELEAMIRPGLLDGVDALREAVANAGLTVPELDVVLVTGGVSATPLVGLLLADELGRPVVLPGDPLGVAAAGAAVVALDHWEASSASTTVPLPLPLAAAVVPEPAAAQLTDLPESFAPPLPAVPVGRPARRHPRQRALLAAAGGALAVAAAVIPLTIINAASPSVPSEEAGRGAFDGPGTAAITGTGADARGKPQVVPTDVPVPATTGRVAPLPVVPVNPRTPAPHVPSTTAQPTTTGAPPPGTTPAPRPTTTPGPTIPPSEGPPSEGPPSEGPPSEGPPSEGPPSADPDPPNPPSVDPPDPPTPSIPPSPDPFPSRSPAVR